MSSPASTSTVPNDPSPSDEPAAGAAGAAVVAAGAAVVTTGAAVVAVTAEELLEEEVSSLPPQAVATSPSAKKRLNDFVNIFIVPPKNYQKPNIFFSICHMCNPSSRLL